MCGICGVVQIGGTPREVVSASVLDAMTDSMTHRGPDDRGTYSAPGIALGVRRLSIVDVAGGHQPVFSENGAIVAIQNGELYNHVELRNELARDDHVLASRCDTEVLPHLYEAHGPRYPEHLRGKFAIAIWDEQRRQAVLARDRLGVKPLYWAQAGDLVVFASEIKAVLVSGLVSTDLDLEAVDLFMTLGYVPGPRTLLASVRKLGPGAILEIDERGPRESTYWAFPEPLPESHGRTLDDCADELIELLRAAVRDRLMSDVPLGAMLSGGLDSSLVVALMAEASSDPVVTFSVGFREDPSSELGDARRVADAFGCKHHELELSVSEDILDLDELVWHLDEPVADLSALGFDLLSKLASQHVTVALAGQGADELFGGYRKHRAAAAMRPLVALPDVTRRFVSRVPWRSARIQRAASALAATDASGRLIAMSGRIDPALRAALYRSPLAAVDTKTAYCAVERARNGVEADVLGQVLYLDAKLALVDDMLLYFDKTSMAHSLEVRVPFLDHRLVEWSAKVPSSFKVHRGVTKRVLKGAGARFLPSQTVHKRKVGFFRYAVKTWLLAQLDGEAGARLLAPDPAYAELLDRQTVVALVDEFRRTQAEDTARLVFAVLMLEAWLTSFRSRAQTIAAAAR